MKLAKTIFVTSIILCFLICIYFFVASNMTKNSNTSIDLTKNSNTSIDLTENSNAICVTNTIKIAVYLPNMSTVIFDPLYTAMFFSDNLDYLNDSNMANKLTTSNYALLLVPKQEMSDASATVINNYISNGGSVWFFADPSYLPNESVVNNRITLLGKPVYSANNTISSNCTITVNNTDVITSGMPPKFSPVLTKAKWYFFRSFGSETGTISGFNYNVLMHNGNCAMLIKFENPKTGARVIYSNENMFISGGDWSYFNASLATKLFLQAKSWILKLAPNTYGVDVTYPNGDKQLTITLDDEQAATYEIPKVQAFFAMERSHGIDPSNVNTFFIIPTNNTTEAALMAYSQNGDIHTLHPHFITDWTNNQSVSDYDASIMRAKGIIDNISTVNNNEFTSLRFPSTAFCTNSLKAMTDNGFLIESSMGRSTNHGKIGTQEDNNMLFPKRIIIDGIKTNTIEMESVSSYDLDTANGSAFYQTYARYLPYLANVNFPAVFVVSGHFQCAATRPDYINGVAEIIDSSKATNTSYATLNTLGKYNNAIQSAKIIAANSENGVDLEVTTSTQIDNFTIKLTNITNGVRAEYNGFAVGNDSIVRDDSTYYVVHTVGTGTHTFTIRDQS
jgi:hypothetical protein